MYMQQRQKNSVLSKFLLTHVFNLVILCIEKLNNVSKRSVANMHKAELVEKVAEKSGVTKKVAHQVVDSVFETIAEALKAGEKVQLIGFGSFEVRNRAERAGRNPQTGEEITIPASKAPAFKAGKALKEIVNQ